MAVPGRGHLLGSSFELSLPAGPEAQVGSSVVSDMLDTPPHTPSPFTNTNPLSLPAKPVSHQLPLLRGRRLTGTGTQSSDQGIGPRPHPTLLLPVHVPPVCLSRVTGRCSMSQDDLSPSKTRDILVSFQDPRLFTPPEGIRSLFLEAANQCGEDPEPRGRARSGNPTQTCLTPGPTTVLTHSSLSGGSAVRSIAKGRPEDGHPEPDKGVQEVWDSQNAASLGFQQRNEAVWGGEREPQFQSRRITCQVEKGFLRSKAVGSGASSQWQKVRGSLAVSWKTGGLGADGVGAATYWSRTRAPLSHISSLDSRSPPHRATEMTIRNGPSPTSETCPSHFPSSCGSE